jgi:hypothetical protein
LEKHRQGKGIGLDFHQVGDGHGWQLMRVPIVAQEPFPSRLGEDMRWMLLVTLKFLVFLNLPELAYRIYHELIHFI